jgi:hypothetical protein
MTESADHVFHGDTIAARKVAEGKLAGKVGCTGRVSWRAKNMRGNS